MSGNRVGVASDSAAKDVLLAEYEALKAEQKSRIASRDRMVYVALAALTATVTPVVQQAGGPHLLLLLPVVCVVLGWTHLANDQKITAIGGYLRRHLAPALTAVDEGAARVLTWESVHRHEPLRRLDKVMQLVVDLLVFVVPSLLSTTLYWTSAAVRADLLAVSVAEVLITLAFAARVVAAARSALTDGRPGRDSRPPPRKEVEAAVAG
ncbi:hypothetical protein [Saccharothrix coeruleofusca]|uniref:Integral membrane protein n=1 Tax=Saccharothrix coeruleofusca TaxID=33919 RepID=A0A918EIF5_9PSEU|nr:hypothetical protein [Saccharothrix coeruleofusca]MBP2338829.1 hypothetical protein [Saccharothrix coeruleofusca]GGP85906.1 hypothetical protein GCM10010185_69550 [Saccharothrix coeruleofusca]